MQRPKRKWNFRHRTLYEHPAGQADDAITWGFTTERVTDHPTPDGRPVYFFRLFWGRHILIAWRAA